MADSFVIPPEQYKRSTWKNGLGYTDQIAIFPENASLARGDFLWRISSARIEKASPFSPFPDHDRILVILKGEGVRLTHEIEPGVEDEAEVPPFSPYEFPGEIPSRCELLGGAVTDLSVFVRKGEIEAQVEPVELGASEEFVWQPRGEWNYAFAVEGAFESGELRVPQHGSLSVGEGEAILRALHPSRLLLISLARAAG